VCSCATDDAHGHFHRHAPGWPGPFDQIEAVSPAVYKARRTKSDWLQAWHTDPSLVFPDGFGGVEARLECYALPGIAEASRHRTPFGFTTSDRRPSFLIERSSGDDRLDLEEMLGHANSPIALSIYLCALCALPMRTPLRVAKSELPGPWMGC
jgi:hypothetical protein